MSVQEIIYTSAQKGLKPGSSGFCTVVCTAGMDQRTASRLEGLSGYRHPFEINDPRNPINFQHITMRIGAANTHVLSRVSDAGPDHTGRTNKLAHHIAFTQPPSPSGPARLWNFPGLFATEWDGKTSQRAAPTLPSIPLADVTLSQWAKLTKDGGWAGHIAEQLISSKQPVYVLFSAGTDTFSLLQEILDVVPANRRWQVTFSTYYTNPVAGAECQLRFVLDGTKDATKLRNDARAAVVDLTTSLPKATGGELVTLARSGVVSQAAAIPKQRPQPNADSSIPAPGKSANSSDDDWMEPDADDFNSAPPSGALSSTQVGVGSKRPPAPDLFRARRAQKDKRLAAAGKRSGKGKVIGLIFIAMLLLVSVSAGVWFAAFGPGADIGGDAQVEASTDAASEAKGGQAKVAADKEPEVEASKPEPVEQTPEVVKAPLKIKAPKLAEKKSPKPVVEMGKTIFGDSILAKAESDPVIRIIPWSAELSGLDIPIDPDADKLDFVVHHHQVNFDVKADGKGWRVIGGIPPTKGDVAVVKRPQQNRLEIRGRGVDPNISWAVCQLTAGHRTGFVLFQKPERSPPVSLGLVMNDLSEKNFRATQVISTRRLDENLTQRIEIKDNTGRTVSQANTTLPASERQSSLAYDVQSTIDEDQNVYFDFVGGPSGCEHRHSIRLLHHTKNRPQSELVCEVEFAKRGLYKATPPLGSVPNGTGWKEWGPWLTDQVFRLNTSYEKRNWERVRSNLVEWCDRESEKLSSKTGVTERGLEELHRRLSDLKTADAKTEEEEEDAKRFSNKAPALAVAEHLKDTANNHPKLAEYLNGWDVQKRLVEGIKGQHIAAKNSREKLAGYELHFSVYLTISRIKLPNCKTPYQLQVPVVEFSRRENDSSLNWNDILSEDPGQPSFRPERETGVNGGPQAPAR